MIHENKFSKKLLELGLKNHYSNAAIEVTNRCNARCGYCYIADKKTPDLPAEKMFFILDKLADAGIISLTVTGGEPFIRDDILEIIEYSIKKEFWRMNLLSNGTLLNDRHIDFIIEHKDYISDIQFSVFSHHASVHDSYTGIDGGLSRILKNAEKLQKGGVFIRFAFSIFDFNITEIQETYAFFAKFGFDFRIGVTKLHTGDVASDANGGPGVKNGNTTCSFYEKFLRQAPEQFINYEKKRFFKEINDTTPLSETMLCVGIHKNICVDAQGNLRPCSSFRNLIVGNIFETGSLFELTSRSESLQKLKKLRRSDMRPCNTCKHNRSCCICPGIVHTETGQCRSVPEQICNYAKAIENRLQV